MMLPVLLSGGPNARRDGWHGPERQNLRHLLAVRGSRDRSNHRRACPNARVGCQGWHMKFSRDGGVYHLYRDAGGAAQEEEGWRMASLVNLARHTLLFWCRVPVVQWPIRSREADRGCASAKDPGGNRGASRLQASGDSTGGRAFSGTTDPGAECWSDWGDSAEAVSANAFFHFWTPCCLPVYRERVVLDLFSNFRCPPIAYDADHVLRRSEPVFFLSLCASRRAWLQMHSTARHITTATLIQTTCNSAGGRCGMFHNPVWGAESVSLSGASELKSLCAYIMRHIDRAKRAFTDNTLFVLTHHGTVPETAATCEDRMVPEDDHPEIELMHEGEAEEAEAGEDVEDNVLEVPDQPTASASSSSAASAKKLTALERCIALNLVYGTGPIQLWRKLWRHCLRPIQLLRQGHGTSHTSQPFCCTWSVSGSLLCCVFVFRVAHGHTHHRVWNGEHHTHHRVWKGEHVFFFGALMQFLALCFGETREINVLCSGRSMVASLKREAIDGRPPPGVDARSSTRENSPGLDTLWNDRLTPLFHFQCGGACSFSVGGVNRLVNFVDDRDLCLLYCVKYDSYLITGFVVQSAHFQKLPLPVLFFGRSVSIR